MKLERKARKTEKSEDSKRHLRKGNDSSSPPGQSISAQPSIAEIVGTRSAPDVTAHAALLANAASEESVRSLTLQLQKSYGNTYVQRLLEKARANDQPRRKPSVDRTTNDRSVVQRAWTEQEVKTELQTGAPGVRAELVRGGYTVHKFDELTIRKEVDGNVSEGSLHGYHCRPDRMIGVSADESPASAAATVVHESQHAQQYEEWAAEAREDFGLVEREYEAHLREEQFRIEHGEPPKKPEFRAAGNVINEREIMKWVKSNYGQKSVRRYYPTGHPDAGKPISEEDLRHIHNLAANDTEVSIW